MIATSKLHHWWYQRRFLPCVYPEALSPGTHAFSPRNAPSDLREKCPLPEGSPPFWSAFYLLVSKFCFWCTGPRTVRGHRATCHQSLSLASFFSRGPIFLSVGGWWECIFFFYSCVCEFFLIKSVPYLMGNSQSKGLGASVPGLVSVWYGKHMSYSPKILVSVFSCLLELHVVPDF